MSLQLSRHEIWPCPGNTATPLIRPIFWEPLVTVLTGFYCTDLKRRIIYSDGHPGSINPAAITNKDAYMIYANMNSGD